MSNIDQTSSFLQQFANKALQKATDTVNNVQSWNLNNKDIGFDYAPGSVNIEKPPKLADLLNDGEKEDVDFLLLNDAAEAWMSKYFPNINSCLTTQPDEWACGILSGERPFGMNRDAFDAAWHDGRDRAYRQASSERSQIVADYSLRGFSQPPGAAIAAMRAADVRANEAIADINRQQTIKDAEMKLDLIKFAAQTSVQLKTSMMQMVASFFGKIVDLRNHDKGADKLRARAQAYSSFMSGIANYHNVELGFEQLRLEAAKAKAGVTEVNAKLKLDGTVKGIDSKNSAIGAAARGFADAAGAAANAQSSLQAELFSGQI